MANFIFDGTASVTAAKADNVLIAANPALFTSQAQVGGNVVFSYSNGTTLTVTGTTLGDSATNLPGIQLASGTFGTGATVNSITTPGLNSLYFGGTTEVISGANFTANSVHTVFGGNGVSDPADAADTVTIGGKGSFLVYGNEGADSITQDANAFDSTSAVTIFGGKNSLGVDSITLTATGATANSQAKMAIYGGEGSDSITVSNTGSNAVTTIFGGQGAADSTDGADSIIFDGGGTVNIFANAGNDTVSLGATTAIDSTGVVTVHGGIGGDTINIKAAGTAGGEVKISIVAFGDENTSTQTDTITIGGNAGTTTIYGGTAAADSADGADAINYSGQGTAFIYAAGGNDTVVVNTSGSNVSVTDGTTAVGNGGAAVAQNSASVANVFLGNGDDTVNVLNSATVRGVTNLTGGAGNDSFKIGNNADVAAGQSGSGLSVTITDFGTGLDTLTINNNVLTNTAAATAVATPTGGFASLQAALNAAATGTGTEAAGTVRAVTFGGDTYVVLNNSTTADAAGNSFNSGLDFAVKLTGITSATAVAAQTIIV